MKRKFSPARGLCTVALASVFVSGWALSVPALLHTESAAHAAVTSTPAEQKRKRKKTSAPLPVVQEIDADGLKKILQRDATQPRPLLINFWATWCIPCREEFPDLVRIDKDYRPRKLEFVIISLDDPMEIKTTVPRFLQQMRAEMPAYLLNATEPDVVINLLDPQWAGGLPATFLLDASGQVVYKHLGPVKPAELRAEIDKVITGGQNSGVRSQNPE